MRLGWFQNPDNIVYCDVDEFADNFGNELGIFDFRTELDKFRKDPVKEGVVLKGRKRSAVKLFVPNLYFDKEIEMGDTVWVFIGETYPAYCLYWNEGHSDDE